MEKYPLYESVLDGGLGRALGVDGGWLPLPTHPQQYCDSASLVPLLFSRVLRDSTTRYVGPLVGRLVGRSPFDYFGVFELFEHTAPAQMPW